MKFLCGVKCDEENEEAEAKKLVTSVTHGGSVANQSSGKNIGIKITKITTRATGGKPRIEEEEEQG